MAIRLTRRPFAGTGSARRLSICATLVSAIVGAGCPGGGRHPPDHSDDATSQADGLNDDVPPLAPMIIHGCTDEAYTNRSDPGAERTVYFGTVGFVFDPPCMRIARGQSVTFTGPFSSHTLTPGVAPGRVSDDPGSPDNPIQQSNSGSSATFTFNARGYYPYYCQQHWNSNMYGVILVP